MVSSTGNPLHCLTIFLQQILRESLPALSSCCRNSFDFISKLKDIHIPDFALVFSDVTLLFTNVPIDLVLTVLDNRWNLIECHTSLPKHEFLDAIKLVLNSTYFKFNNKIYRQTYGTPMSSPLSPIVADLALQNLQNLELHTLDKISFISSFSIRYVDDIALAAPYTLFELLDTFNSFHSRVKFTMEVGGLQLNFLELIIINRNGFMTFD